MKIRPVGAELFHADGQTDMTIFFNVLLTLRLSIILDNDQLDTHLLYFTIRLL
jgi:hypothetical protein